jgi:hypothetical protein
VTTKTGAKYKIMKSPKIQWLLRVTVMSAISILGSAGQAQNAPAKPAPPQLVPSQPVPSAPPVQPMQPQPSPPPVQPLLPAPSAPPGPSAPPITPAPTMPPVNPTQPTYNNTNYLSHAAFTNQMPPFYGHGV